MKSKVAHCTLPKIKASTKRTNLNEIKGGTVYTAKDRGRHSVHALNRGSQNTSDVINKIYTYH